MRWLVAVDTIEKAIYSLLTTNGVSDLVSTRVYPLILPQPATFPAVTYQRITGDWGITMDGAHNYAEEVFQINTWAATYDGARTLADAVRKVLDNHSGTTGSVYIHVIHLEDEGDLLNMTDDVRGSRTFAKRQDYRIWYKEVA